MTIEKAVPSVYAKLGVRPVIHEGAGSGYFGPCPPSGTHRYEITVVARDGQSRAVASGEKIVVTGK